MSLQQWLAIYENWAPAHLVRMRGRGIPVQVARDAIEFARQQMLDQRPTAAQARAWLRRVADNHAAELLKTEGNHGRILGRLCESGQRGQEATPENESPVNRVVMAEFLELMWQEIEPLPTGDQDLLWWHYIEKRTLREIAEHLEMSTTWVHKTIADLLAQLQRRLRQRGIQNQDL